MLNSKSKDEIVAALVPLANPRHIASIEDIAPDLAMILRALKADIKACTDCQDTHYCSACGEPQFSSPSGMTCVNGHGGADSILVEDLYVGVLDPDGEEVEWEGYERLPYNPTNAYRFSVKTTPSQYFSAAYFSAQKGGIRVKHKQLLDLILVPTP